MRPRASAAEWRKRVEHWRESGLSADQFAAEIGVGAPTLRVWSSKFKRADSVEALGSEAKPSTVSPGFVEIRAAGVDARFELELGNGRRVRVPEGFDPKALERLLGVLDRR